MGVSQHAFLDELSRIHPPQQDRSRLAQQAALDAFEELLAERPFAKVTVQEIADRANLSITSLYARFDGKDALVLALHERVIREGVAQLEVALADDEIVEAPVDEIVAMLVDRTVAFAHANAHVFRAVLTAADDETNERAAAFLRLGSERISSVLAPRLATAATHAMRDIDFAWRSLVAVLQQSWALGGAEPSRFPLSPSELAKRLTQQFLMTIGHHADQHVRPTEQPTD
ncbi:MAG: helix-turn-helix domain-containing protein [Ilumatobacteraceae bacterium]